MVDAVVIAGTGSKVEVSNAEATVGGMEGWAVTAGGVRERAEGGAKKGGVDAGKGTGYGAGAGGGCGKGDWSARGRRRVSRLAEFSPTAVRQKREVNPDLGMAICKRRMTRKINDAE